MYDNSFGNGGGEGASIKSKLVTLIGATRTLMRSESKPGMVMLPVCLVLILVPGSAIDCCKCCSVSGLLEFAAGEGKNKLTSLT